MNLLVLYSWEKDFEYSQKWTMALCHELEKYKNIKAECDMLLEPKSNTKTLLKNKIQSADKLLVVVTKSYNEKLLCEQGMVSFEEKVYKELVEKDKYNNKIVFLLKDENIKLPSNWESYYRIDVSKLNSTNYFEMTNAEKTSIFQSIIRFCNAIPEYELHTSNKKLNTPKPKKAESFKKLFSEYYNEEKPKTLAQQETELLRYITRNMDQESFVYQYIKAGLAADTNLNGRMTPGLFIKHFFVKREDTEERQYNSIIKNLFASNHHNMLCIQSDGGSGKSTFIQTLGYKEEHKVKKDSIYNNIIFDLSQINENISLKEDVLFQKVKKIYRKMSREDEPNKTYYKTWRNNFKTKVDLLKEVDFQGTELFKLYEFQEALNIFLDNIIPFDSMDNWYTGFSKRLTYAKENERSNILFVILLMTYLLILDSKPINHEKKECYTIVFDNIETYDNGETAKKIATYIENCHTFVKRMFMEMGAIDSFFFKFTFVIVIRTSTLIHFGNIQSDIWGEGKYIKHIKFFDFSTEALLKKLIYLKKIKNYQDTTLYKKMYLLMSLIIPINVLNNYLECNGAVSTDYRYFTSKRLLPFFNNNFRRAMGYLSKYVLSEENFFEISSKLNDLYNRTGSFYDFSIHGIRMSIFRNIFQEFQDNGYFKIMGFSYNSNGADCSLTRMILSHLYWDEHHNTSYLPNYTYDGMALSDLVDFLIKYRGVRDLSKSLYGLSLFAKRDPEKKVALNAWGCLLIFKNLNIDLSENDFVNIVQSFVTQNQTTITVNGEEVELSDIKVKLSDAGLCFAQYYIRSFEFLMSRHNNNKALFMLPNQDAATEITKMYDILKNCINRIILPSKVFCYFWNPKKDTCKYKLNDITITRCPLFLRYQECLDLIREIIWYIDRYRIVVFMEKEDVSFNNILLDLLIQFYGLYGNTETLLFSSPCKHDVLNKFLNTWQYSKTFYPNKLDTENNHRIELIRPLQSFFSKQTEDIHNAIEYIKQKPETTLYDALQLTCI